MITKWLVFDISKFALLHFWYIQSYVELHCVKSIRIRSFSGRYLPAFELNTERYFLSLRF